jgi:hypothetical protein
LNQDPSVDVCNNFSRSLIPKFAKKHEYENILSPKIQHGKKNSEFDSEFVEKGCEMLKTIYYQRESDGKMFVCKSFQRLPFLCDEIF